MIKWFNPQLRSLHRKQQKEYFKSLKSQKLRELNLKLKRLKRKTIQKIYSDAADGLKNANPSQFFSIVKKTGFLSTKGNFQIEQLENLNDVEAAEKIIQLFCKCVKSVCTCRLYRTVSNIGLPAL